MKRKQWRVAIDEALGWELYKTTLQWELTDRAETELNLTETDCEVTVTVEGTDFVVTFEW
jgi:hypothetical protein